MRILQIGSMLGAAALAMPAIAAEPTADAVLKTYADIAFAAYSDSLAGAENLDAAIDALKPLGDGAEGLRSLARFVVDRRH